MSAKLKTDQSDGVYPSLLMESKTLHTNKSIRSKYNHGWASTNEIPSVAKHGSWQRNACQARKNSWCGIVVVTHTVSRYTFYQSPSAMFSPFSQPFSLSVCVFSRTLATARSQPYFGAGIDAIITVRRNGIPPRRREECISRRDVLCAVKREALREIAAVVL